MDVMPVADILIVDDTAANLETLGELLRGHGFRIRVAPDGQRALAAMRRSAPDLVLLDVNMPGMDGYEVCARMKAMETLAGVPVIFLSARAELEDKVKGFKAGGVDYVAKPFQSEEVMARVNAHVNLCRLQRELKRLNDELEERVRVRTAQLVELNVAYQRFVPMEFISLLKKDSVLEVRLGDHTNKSMTVMFSDIRNFTTLSEARSPQVNFDFLNVYLSRVAPLVHKNRGFIDKYIGDAVMSLFPVSADDALRSAVEAVREVKSFSEHLEELGQPGLRTGTGLHTGSLMLGIIGAEDRFQATVIADAVNTASRMESLTKLYGVDILASEEVLEALQDAGSYLHRFLGIMQVKGKEKVIRVHEIFDPDGKGNSDRKLETMGDFEEGLKLYYQKQFADAAVKFDLVSRACPDDVASKLYLKRAAYFLGNGAPPGWTGVESA